MLNYLRFVIGFTGYHTVAYIIAGATALKISGDLYRKDDRLYDYHRDMSNEKESSHVKKYFIPAQILRGILMALVLIPIRGFLGDISFLLRFGFLAGVMIVYADLACANPFSHNIEGFVYLKEEYLDKKFLPKLYFETFGHGIVFGLLAAWRLF